MVAWRVKAAALGAAGVFAAAAAGAQLFPYDAAGLRMGHVLLNVTDVPAHVRFWTTQFDARAISVGSLQGVVIPGAVVLFRAQRPTGPAEGTTINHMGLKLNRLADFTARFDKAGYKYEPPRIGRESTPQTYVTGPDGFRMELVEDPRIPAPAVSHHLHYWLERPADVKQWYVQKLMLKPTLRGPYESGDVPGMNLTFAPLGSQKVPGVPMRGRLMDSIGFDVADLGAYTEKIRNAGVALEAPPAVDRELGLPSAVLMDPWGVPIRLTQGLSAAAGVTSYSYTDGFVVVKPIE